MSQTNNGLVIIYTGDGKGKTTAAVGLAVRAAGRGQKVLIIQFVKTWPTGEIAGLKKLSPNIEIIQMGKGFYKIQGDRLPEAEHHQAAQAALNFAHERIAKGGLNVLILDEIIGATVGGLINEGDLLSLIDHKPADLSLVLTGRGAKNIPGLIDRADLVTEMVKIKHPFDQGIIAKKGIDF